MIIQNQSMLLPNDSVINFESEVFDDEICDTDVYFGTADEPLFVISGSRIAEFKQAISNLYEEFAI